MSKRNKQDSVEESKENPDNDTFSTDFEGKKCSSVTLRTDLWVFRSQMRIVPSALPEAIIFPEVLKLLTSALCPFKYVK
jgi:hypothetical protein